MKITNKRKKELKKAEEEYYKLRRRIQIKTGNYCTMKPSWINCGEVSMVEVTFKFNIQPQDTEEVMKYFGGDNWFDVWVKKT